MVAYVICSQWERLKSNKESQNLHENSSKFTKSTGHTRSDYKRTAITFLFQSKDFSKTFNGNEIHLSENDQSHRSSVIDYLSLIVAIIDF